MTSSTASDIAAWMLVQIRDTGALYQDVAASAIASTFGEDFVETNQNGNLALTKPVLAAFNRLTGNTVVWSRSDRYWRFRQDFDMPGRQQP